MDYSKGNRGNLYPNIQILLSHNVTKTKCLEVCFLGDSPPRHTPFLYRRLAPLQTYYPHLQPVGNTLRGTQGNPA